VLSINIFTVAEILCRYLAGQDSDHASKHMEILQQEAITKLTSAVVPHDDRPPPPIRKRPPPSTGFPAATPPKSRIRIRRPGPSPNGPYELMDGLDPDNRNDLPLGSETRRYDFLGSDITGAPATPATELAGLHNHNDDEERSGYAIYELAMMCRSRNSSQRVLALTSLARIIARNRNAVDSARESQVPLLAVNSMFPPTNAAIMTAAADVIVAMLAGQINEPFALVPYPAIPPPTSMTLEFAKFAEQLVDAASLDERLISCLALLMPCRKFEIGKLAKLTGSKALFRLGRAAFVFWEERFAEEQAKTAITSSDIELAKEAAALLRHINLEVTPTFCESLLPCVLAILLSRIDSDLEAYTQFIPAVAELCPDPFALEFLANFAQKGLLDRATAEKALTDSTFSSATVTLSLFCEKSIRVPELPTNPADCWSRRGLICGGAEYVMRTRDYSILPRLLPCLYTFTNPAADMLFEVIFEMEPIKERPIDPYAIFERFATTSVPNLRKLLVIAQHFPIRFMLPIFSRPDLGEISPIVCEFLDGFDDPLPAESLKPADLSSFFDRFLFDSFFIPCCQKLAYFCVSPGAHVEVRQHFWGSCSRLLSRFCVPNVRRDVLEFDEDDREVMATIVHALKESRIAQNDIIGIAVHQLRKYVEARRGEHLGQVFYDQIRRMPEFWAKQILVAFQSL
jgi:hypothetical protein